MGDSILGVSVEELTTVFRKLLELFKKLMAWLGILVLPEEDEKTPGLYPDSGNGDMDDILGGA